MASSLVLGQPAVNFGPLVRRVYSCQGRSIHSGQARSQSCHALLTPSPVAQPRRALRPSAAPAILAPTRDNDGIRRSQLIAAASSAVREVPGDQFESEVLKADVPVLVDFWATWCGPCRLIVPVLDWAAKEYEGKLKVVKMEVDANPTLVEQYKVYGLPTVILFKGGEVVPGGHFEGALTKAKLKELLSEKLPSLTPTAAAS